MLTLTPAAFAAPWYESYKKAEEALAAEDWEEAVKQLRLALEEKGDSSVRARTYGVNFREYFPYFKLGVAFYGLGDYDNALQALDTEERLGAITQSPASHEELRDYRGRIEQAKGALEQERIASIVTENLARARQLERQGRHEEALAAVDRALTVSGDDDTALQIKSRLLDEIAARQGRLEQERVFTQLLEDGKSQLAAQRYQDAASSFNRALSLKADSSEAATLLEQAQSGLRRVIEAEQDESRRQSSIAAGLRQANDLESAGDYLRALDALQSVLALEPGNAEALTLQRRLQQAQAQLEKEEVKTGNVRRLLTEAVSQYDAADYDGSLLTANRALALDRENVEARAAIQRAYIALSQSVLGSATRVENLPPATTFVNLTNAQLADSIAVEWVQDAAFVLRGNVFDTAQVALAFEAEIFDIFSTSERLEHPDGTREQAAAWKALDGTVRGRDLGGVYMTEFTLPVKLDPGVWVLRVTATDDDGASALSQHVVLYTRPWYREPAAYTAMGALVLVLFGGVYALRVNRRNKQLKRRFNPYIAGAPILKNRSFFGRERLLNYVLQRIHNNSILLYGERRIGKTSLQHRLKKRLTDLKDPEYRFFPVLVDLQGTPEDAFFSTVATDIFHELEPFLDGVEPSPALADGKYDYRHFVLDVRKVIKALRARSDKTVKLVLQIDEVDELNSYDPRTNQKLRSLFMKSFADSMVAVVSGVSIKKDWEREGSPWYNFFQEIEVKPFRREDAVELIEAPIRGVFKLDDGVVDNIIERTDCKPYLIQKLCAALVNRLHEERRRKITLADVEASAHVMET